MTLAPPISAADARRLGPLLGFAPSVAARFEQDTRRERVRQLRLAILVGLVFYNAYDLASYLVTPELQRVNLLLRLGVVTPASLVIAWLIGHVPGRVRETMLAVGAIGVSSAPAYLVWASDAAYANHATTQLLLLMVFGTTVLMLRFAHALVYVAAHVAFVGPCYLFNGHTTPRQALELVLQMTLSAGLAAYANYRIERAARLAYLRSLRASLRSADLQDDKAALERLSSVDPLTGIANRRRLSEWLAAWQADPHSRTRPLGVIMIDVDHFKRYNDRFGHPAGDLCLKRIATTLATCLRDEHDLVARYGGEEFALLLHDADAGEAGRVAGRVCESVAAIGMPHDDRDDGIEVVTVSAGAAAGLATGRRRMQMLFDSADAALYQAKTRGRNRRAVAEPAGEPTSDTPSDLAPLSSTQ